MMSSSQYYFFKWCNVWCFNFYITGKTKTTEELVKGDGVFQTKDGRKKEAARHFLYRQNEKTKRQFLEYEAVQLDEEVDKLNDEIQDLGGSGY